MLRDKFAMAAMQGFCANLGFYSVSDDVAERAYQFADAMMRERQNWDFSDDPDNMHGHTDGYDAQLRKDLQSDCLPVAQVDIQPQPQEATAADVWGAAFKHHEATQGKAVPPEEWQPDWSQAPEWANWWFATMGGGIICGAVWTENKPEIGPCTGNFSVYFSNGAYEKSSTFGYKGDWRDSLRKRPTKPVPPVTETPPLKMEAP